MNKKNKKLTRYSALFIIMFIIFFSIIARLAYLQIKDVDVYKEMANRKAIKEISEIAPRGNILDRNGNILAGSKQSYMVSFMETDESQAKFFDTMETVFKMLDKNEEVQKDNFELKISPFKFEFNSSDPKVIRIRELRFKKDKGFDDDIIEEHYPGKRKDSLTKEEWKVIDEELLKITPEQAFNKLWAQYTEKYIKNKKVDDEVKQRIKSYNLEQQRRFMIVKDAIKMQSFSGYKPTIIADDIKKDTAFLFYQKLSQLPGINVVLQPKRYYPNNDIGSSVLGYISKISPEKKEKYEEKGYDVNSDLIGVSGIENVFEDRLKGSKGVKIVQVNSQGRMIKEKASKEPYPGQNIQSTLDKDVQYAADKALDKQMKILQNEGMHQGNVDTSNATRGAAVAIDINTGGLLALSSRPGFNPNDFVTGNLSKKLVNEYFHPDLESFGREYIRNNNLHQFNKVKKSEEEMLNILFPVDKNIKNNTKIRQDYYDIYPKPLYNYALQGLMAPGSTFKPLTAVAGLEEGVIGPNEIVNTKGIFNKYLESYTGKCWIWTECHSTHGPINITEALEKSCNYFFYEVGQRLYVKGGYDLLAKYAWRFGLGIDPSKNQKPSTGIELSNTESFGQVYNIEYAKRNKSAIFMNSLINDIKAGKDRKKNHYKAGINLNKNDSDSNEEKKLKDKIIDTIKNQLIADKGKLEIKKTRSDLTQYFTKLTTIDSELKALNFSKEDISKVTNAAIFAIYDGHQEIVTEANVYDASIGQGINLFTPLQLCNYMATLANGGTRYKLHLVDKYLDQNDKVIQQIKPQVMDKIDLKPNTLATVKKGMAKVTGEQGTASSAFTNFPISTGGKTGSSTFVGNIQDDMGRTSYGVYVGFAPIENPQIAVCVVIFDGGHGGYVAPVAKAMYEAYFKDELISRNYTPQEDFMKDMFKKD